MANTDRFGLARREPSLLSPLTNEWFMSPFGMMRRMAEEMNQLLNVGLGMPWGAPSVTLVPNVDVRETSGSYVVEADLPGLRASDLDVQVHGDTLIIRGHSERHAETQDQGYHVTERRVGNFHREVALPGPVDPAHCTADYENGVLQIRLPKSEQAAGQRITVTSGAAGVKHGSTVGVGTRGEEDVSDTDVAG